MEGKKQRHGASAPLAAVERMGDDGTLTAG
jgi:hypothetical protein